MTELVVRRTANSCFLSFHKLFSSFSIHFFLHPSKLSCNRTILHPSNYGPLVRIPVLASLDRPGVFESIQTHNRVSPFVCIHTRTWEASPVLPPLSSTLYLYMLVISRLRQTLGGQWRYFVASSMCRSFSDQTSQFSSNNGVCYIYLRSDASRLPNRSLNLKGGLDGIAKKILKIIRATVLSLVGASYTIVG